MKYLHSFEEEAQFNSEYFDDEKYFEPWVSLTKEIEKVNYNKKANSEYLTFEILTSGELYLGEILYTELFNSFNNTIKNDDSDSDNYLYIDKLNNSSNATIGEMHKSAKSIRSKKNFYSLLQEFPTLPGIKYSLNDGEWLDWEIDPDTYYRTLEVETGDIVRIKGDKSYPNIFSGNSSWIDPRDLDNTMVIEVEKQQETITKNFTITVDHLDIDFDSSELGNLSDINSWYNSDLFDYEENNIDTVDNINLGAGRNVRGGRNIQDFSASIDGNLFTYKGKVKYRFENIIFNTITPTTINPDILINCLFEINESGISQLSLFPKIYNATNYLFKNDDFSYDKLVSINDTDDSHIKYLSYNLYNLSSHYEYGNYYGSGGYVTDTNYLGISIFGFLLYNDNGELIGYSSIYDTFENQYNLFEREGNFSFLYPNKDYYQYIIDYIYNNDFSDKLTFVFNPQNAPSNNSGPFGNSNFPTPVESNEVLFVFTYDQEYLQSLIEKYFSVENLNSSLLRDRRFNFRSSDECTFNVSGNIASLYYGDDFKRHIIYKSEGLFAGLFYHCDGLISCKDIILSGYSLSPYCYMGMFSYCINLIETFEEFSSNVRYEEASLACMFFGCTSLTSTPGFPTVESHDGLFYAMYYGCSNLTNISTLNRFTNISKSLFAYTFSKCDSLEELPDLSSFVKIKDKGCFCMFSNCSGLTEIPDLHFSIVFNYGIAGMFYNCSSLETIGKITFDNIDYNGAEKMFAKCSLLVNTDSVYCNNNNSSDYSYAYMFSECVELIYPPELPQQKLSPYCYYKMFYKCHKLLSAPELVAVEGKLGTRSSGSGIFHPVERNRGGNTRGVNNVVTGNYLSPGCYESMFEDCILLNCNLTLPAVKLHNRCYYKMFKNCQSLRRMPTIQAKEVGSYSFAFMFSNCTSLVETSPIPGILPLDLGNSGGGSCSSSFSLGLNLLSSTRSLPLDSNYEEETIGYNYNYGSNTGEGAFANMFEYCTSLVTMPDIYCVTFSEKMCYNMFYNCTSLRNSRNFHALVISGQYTFAYMFENCISLTSTPQIDHNISMESFFETYPPDEYDFSYEIERTIRNTCDTVEEFENLDLSLQSVADSLFDNNSNLSYTFLGMFMGCSSLTTINDIYISFPYNYTFSRMFYNCTGLQRVINNFIHFNTRKYTYNNTLYESVFSEMFKNCTSLISVPRDFLLYTHLEYNIYKSMFENCTSLIQAPDIIDTTKTNYIYSYVYESMFKNCTSLEEVHIYISDITKTVNNSFNEMFYGCSSLNKIYTNFHNSESSIRSNALSNWVYGVSSTGTFYEDFNYPWDIRGTSYIPEGWIISYPGINIDGESILNLNYPANQVEEIDIYCEDSSIALSSFPDWVNVTFILDSNNWYKLTITSQLATSNRLGNIILYSPLFNETKEIPVSQINKYLIINERFANSGNPMYFGPGYIDSNGRLVYSLHNFEYYNYLYTSDLLYDIITFGGYNSIKIGMNGTMGMSNSRFTSTMLGCYELDNSSYPNTRLANSSSNSFIEYQYNLPDTNEHFFCCGMTVNGSGYNYIGYSGAAFYIDEEAKYIEFGSNRYLELDLNDKIVHSTHCFNIIFSIVNPNNISAEKDIYIAYNGDMDTYYLKCSVASDGTTTLINKNSNNENIITLPSGIEFSLNTPLGICDFSNNGYIFFNGLPDKYNSRHLELLTYGNTKKILIGNNSKTTNNIDSESYYIRIYSISIYNHSSVKNTIMNLIPRYMNEEPYFYDTITGEYYSIGGSGHLSHNFI